MSQHLIVRGADVVAVGGKWLVEEFPKMVAMIPYTVCCLVVEDEVRGPCKRIEFSTRGWSGCEDLVDAVLGNRLPRSITTPNGSAAGTRLRRVDAGARAGRDA